MSRKKVTIEDSVMGRIESGQITVRPKIYFVTASLITIIGMALSFVSFIYSMALVRFLSKEHGPMGAIRFQELINSLPWWFIPFSLITLTIGLLSIRQKPLYYKSNIFTKLIILLISLIFAYGFVYIFDLDQVWFKNNRQFRQQNHPSISNSFGSNRVPFGSQP